MGLMFKGIVQGFLRGVWTPPLPPHARCFYLAPDLSSAPPPTHASARCYLSS